METNLVIFASGTPDGGATGARNLIQHLPGRTLAVVSSWENGGARKVATEFFLPFYYFPGPYTSDGYRDFVGKMCAELGARESDLWYALSGWFKRAYWLSSARTFNIHPAPLPRFGGKGMYGENLHRCVWDAYKRGEITNGEIVMHFVTSKIDDERAIFFRHIFSLRGCGSYDEYREAVRRLEHANQPFLAELVMTGKISWDGVHYDTLHVPPLLSQV